MFYKTITMICQISARAIWLSKGLQFCAVKTRLEVMQSVLSVLSQVLHCLVFTQQYSMKTVGQHGHGLCLS